MENVQIPKQKLSIEDVKSLCQSLPFPTAKKVLQFSFTISQNELWKLVKEANSSRQIPGGVTFFLSNTGDCASFYCL